MLPTPGTKVWSSNKSTTIRSFLSSSLFRTLYYHTFPSMDLVLTNTWGVTEDGWLFKNWITGPLNCTTAWLEVRSTSLTRESFLTSVVCAFPLNSHEHLWEPFYYAIRSWEEDARALDQMQSCHKSSTYPTSSCDFVEKSQMKRKSRCSYQMFQYLFLLHQESSL